MSSHGFTSAGYMHVLCVTQLAASDDVSNWWQKPCRIELVPRLTI